MTHADIYADPLGWLLAARIPPPEPFAFRYPAVPNLVSVVIPAYNASRFLKRCLRSVWEQEYPAASLEIVLCEDGSTDDTYPLAVALQKRSPVAMQVLTHPERTNRGVSATRNLALRHSRGSVIAILDADDMCRPGRIAMPMRFLEANPQFHCVCSLGQYRNAQGKRVRGWGGGFTAGEYRTLDPKLGIRPPYTFDQLLRWYPVVHSTLTVRREALAAVNGYPETFANPGEDWLLTAKLSLLGPIPLIEEELIDRTVHEASWTHRYNTESLAYGARLEFLLHLVHWMLRQPAYRARGMQVYREHYPKLLAGYQHVALILEEFLEQRATSGGSAEMESYLGRLHAELAELREYRQRTERLLAPLRRVPGLKSALRGMWRLSKYAFRFSRI